MAQAQTVRLPRPLDPATISRWARRSWARRAASTRERIVAVLLLLPAMALVFGLIVYPVAYDLALALSDATDVTPPVHFVGLANFAKVFASREFRAAAWNSALYTAVTACVRVVLGVAMALALWRLRSGLGRA